MSISPQSPLGIAKLVSGHKFKVPRFQRAFGWRKSEIQEFFADIGAALKKSGGNDYFLGIVVLMKIDDQHLLIIDGQQRIALTCMIYAAIRERLKHYSPEDSEQAAQLLFDNGGVGKAIESSAFPTETRVTLTLNTFSRSGRNSTNGQASTRTPRKRI